MTFWNRLIKSRRVWGKREEVTGRLCASSRNQSVNSKWSRVMGKAVEWPCELLDRVRWLWDQGLTATEIGEKVDKSRNAIIGKLSRARKQGAKVHTRNTSPKKKKPPKPKKDSAASAVARKAANGSGERMMPPMLMSVPPPPIPDPLPVIDEWDGLVAEVYSIRYGQCRWPLGEPVSGFCRMELDNYREPYCEYHMGIARRKNGHRAGE